jgi:hypothetical protein
MPLPSVLLVLCVSGVAQTTKVADCATLRYKRHTSAWLCGRVMVCSGDICGRPSTYDFDENLDVVLRDHQGRELETKSLSHAEPAFCFTGRGNGDYQLAFVLHKNGVPEAARVFPTRYKQKADKANDVIYMVEVTCPNAPR